MTTQEFIQQMGKMPVANYNDGTIHFENGLEISHSVKLAEWQGDLPLQMVVRVSFYGEYVMTWGAETDEDNRQLVYMWRTMKNRAQERSKDIQQYNSRAGYELLMKGLQ
jgi:hypothetical protein